MPHTLLNKPVNSPLSSDIGGKRPACAVGGSPQALRRMPPQTARPETTLACWVVTVGVRLFEDPGVQLRTSA
jgi:hypothetical protein